MTMTPGSALSAAVSATSPLANPAERSKARIKIGAWHIGCGDAGMGMRVRGQTCARAAALAVREGPPSPVPRPGPIHGMGRAVRYRAHALSGLASARCNTDDEQSSTIARTFVGRPAQADEVRSAREADHDDMRIMRQINRKVQRAHLPALPEMFERTSIGLQAYLLFVEVDLSRSAHLSRLDDPLRLLEPRVSSLADAA